MFIKVDCPKVKNYFGNFPRVISSILNHELSESFLPGAPEICCLLQQFTKSESVAAAAAAVVVISQSSKTVWMFLPCWFPST